MLANFRGFEQIDIDFEEDVTVIAGVNGVGKTGVLEGPHECFVTRITRLTASKEAPLGLSETDVQSGKPGLSVSVTLRSMQQTSSLI